MKQLQTTLNRKEILLVEVPELITGLDYDHLHYDITFFEGKPAFENMRHRSVPVASWKLLGLAADITEDVAEDMVEQKDIVINEELEERTAYMDYLSNGFRDISSIESLHSFIKSHHFNPETTVILIKE